MKPIRLFTAILLLISFSNHAKRFNCKNTAIDFVYVNEQLASISSNSSIVKDQQHVKQQLFDIEGKQYLQLYQQCIKPVIEKQGLVKFDKKQLHNIYTIVFRAAFYSSDLDATANVAEVIFRKIQLGENHDNLIPRLYRLYIQTRQFIKAKKLVNQYPQVSMNEVVTIMDATGDNITPYLPNSDNIRSYFSINEQGNQITRHKFEFPQGAHIVVVSSPICNPCKRLFTWLKSEPKLMKVMAQHTTWLTPVEGQLFVEEMLSTYQTYQPIKLNYAHHQNEWPEISYWATPTFYFYQDGHLVGQLVGWPQEGRKAQLLAVLTKLGLLS